MNGTASRPRTFFLTACLLAGVAAALGTPPPRSSQAQALWSFPVTLNEDRAERPQVSPVLVADTSGALHAVWVELVSGDGEAGTVPSSAVYYARREPGSTAWSAPLRVAGGDDDHLRSDPALAVDSSGVAHVVWTEAADGRTDIWHSRLPVGAAVWEPPFRVNDDARGRVHHSAAIAADLWGSIHVAWVDYRLGTADIYYRRRLPNGQWSANLRINTPDFGDQRAPVLIAAKSGWLYAAWQDSRRANGEIYASSLPPGGDVWWPNALLSHAGGKALQHDPVLATDSTGAVHAMWIDDTEGEGLTLRTAAFRPGDVYWGPDRPIYRAARGQVITTAAAGGPGGQVWVAWTETRPEETRVYAACLAPPPALPGDLLQPERVDGVSILTAGRQPAIAIDGTPRAHIAWQGWRNGRPATEIFQSSRDLDRPSYPPATTEGWLEYRFGVSNCVGDGFVTVACDGQYGVFIRPGNVNLLGMLGSYVVVTGVSVSDTACEHILAQRVELKIPICPRQTSAVTGVLSEGGRPVVDARVVLGARVASTGPTGRYAFHDVPAGTYALTATLACALAASPGDVQVHARTTTLVPDGNLVPGDVVDDCAINLYDLVRVASSFKQSRPLPSDCADVDRDGIVSMYDLASVAGNLGRRCPTAWAAPANPPAPLDPALLDWLRSINPALRPLSLPAP